MNVVDMREFLSPTLHPAEDGVAHAPSLDEDAGRPRGAYFSRIVEAATSSAVRGREFITTVRCRRRPARRGCQGRITVMLTDVPSRLDWWCSCCGDGGVIANWRCTPWDLSLPAGHAQRGELAWVHMPDEVHRALLSLEWDDPHMRRIVRGAESDLDDVLVGGPVFQLALLRDRLAERISGVPSQRGRRLLDQAHLLLDICCAG